MPLAAALGDGVDDGVATGAAMDGVTDGPGAATDVATAAGARPAGVALPRGVGVGATRGVALACGAVAGVTRAVGVGRGVGATRTGATAAGTLGVAPGPGGSDQEIGGGTAESAGGTVVTGAGVACCADAGIASGADASRNRKVRVNIVASATALADEVNRSPPRRRVDPARLTLQHDEPISRSLPSISGHGTPSRSESYVWVGGFRTLKVAVSRSPG